MKSARANAVFCPQRQTSPLATHVCRLSGASIPCRQTRWPSILRVSPSITRAEPVISARARPGSRATARAKVGRRLTLSSASNRARAVGPLRHDRYGCRLAHLQLNHLPIQPKALFAPVLPSYIPFARVDIRSNLLCVPIGTAGKHALKWPTIRAHSGASWPSARHFSPANAGLSRAELVAWAHGPYVARNIPCFCCIGKNEFPLSHVATPAHVATPENPGR